MIPILDQKWWRQKRKEGQGLSRVVTGGTGVNGLMQQMQKDLTRTGAKGIRITFRVSQFQETAWYIVSMAISITLKMKFNQT